MGGMMAFDHDAGDKDGERSDAEILRTMDRLLSMAQKLCGDLEGGERESVSELEDCLAVGKVIVLRLAEEHRPKFN